MAQQPRVKGLALVVVLAGLSGCAVSGGFFSSLGQSDPVEVREVRRALACGSTQDEVALTLMSSPAEYAAWESQRGAHLYGDATLPAGQYLLVEMGRRKFEGYGMAISSAATAKRGLLTLRATFIEPAAGTDPGGEAVSPCSLIKLPDMALETIELIDEDGDRRATLTLEPQA